MRNRTDPNIVGVAAFLVFLGIGLFSFIAISTGRKDTPAFEYFDTSSLERGVLAEEVVKLRAEVSVAREGCKVARDASLLSDLKAEHVRTLMYVFYHRYKQGALPKGLEKWPTGGHPMKRVR